MKLLLVAGSPRAGSRTLRLVEHARDYAERTHADADVDLLDLREEAPEPFRGFDEGYSDATRDVVARVHAADVLLVGSPVYNGTYTAAVKNLFEHVDYKALEDRVAGFVLVAGGDMSFLQTRTHLAQLMAYFHAHVVPRAVFATRDDVDDGPPTALLRRLERLVDKAVETRRALHGEERRPETVVTQ